MQLKSLFWDTRSLFCAGLKVLFVIIPTTPPPPVIPSCVNLSPIPFIKPVSKWQLAVLVQEELLPCWLKPVLEHQESQFLASFSILNSAMSLVYSLTDWGGQWQQIGQGNLRTLFFLCLSIAGMTVSRGFALGSCLPLFDFNRRSSN